MAARSPSCSRRRTARVSTTSSPRPRSPATTTWRPPASDSRTSAARAATRAVCLARLDPWQDDAPDRLAQLLEHPAVRGLLLHPWEETFPANHERALELAVRAAAHGRPVVVEAGHPLLAEALSLADLARRVEGTVVMTRGGQVNMAGLAQQSADLALDAAPNLCALSAGMYRQDWLEGCVRRYGAERLLYGSCAPVFDIGYEAERVRRAHMADDERAAVIGGNAVTLFGLAMEG